MTTSHSLSGPSIDCQKPGDDATVVGRVRRQARDWRCRPLYVGAAVARDATKGDRRCRRKVLNSGYKDWNGS
jgi:hypothetical protein